MGASRLRKGRHSVSGQIYSITFSTKDRRPILNFLSVSPMAAVFTGGDFLRGSELLAWVFMPDHVHLLVQLGNQESLSDFVRRFKIETARSINRHYQSQGVVWSRGFYDRAVRNEDDLTAIARYIVLNPVRAGLVESVRQYCLWDAVWV